MNRLLSLLLCGLLLLVLAACHAAPPDQSLPEETTQPSRTAVTSAETQAAGTETSASETSAASDATAAKTTSAPPPTTTAAPTEPPKAKTVKVTLKSGESMVQMLQKMADAGVNTFDKLLDAAQNYDLSQHPLTASMPAGSDRCYKLEGYLFPDTYEFYVGEVPARALKRILQNTEAKITPAMRARAQELGYTMDQIITMAALIQREGSNPSEMPNIAAIIYNRMAISMRLQMDSSKLYVDKWVKPYISGDYDRFNSLYDTYTCAALPAGPISSPGLGAIKAALYPSDVDYLFFCNDIHANYYYATEWAVHNAKVQELKAAGLLP
jgi:UPF0755 protein